MPMQVNDQAAALVAALEELDDQELTAETVRRLIGMTGNGLVLRKLDRRRHTVVLKYELIIRVPASEDDTARGQKNEREDRS